jgi:membrane associated rhomboid family serine protease
MSSITPAVKYLLIVNIAVYFAESLLRIPLAQTFALPAIWWRTFDFGQLFTYMFVHGGFSHLFMNMLGLFFIGPVVERTLGSYRFFILYYASGILGGLGWSLLAPQYAYCVGASGALMGVLGAFGALYPNATVLLWFVIPIKAWLLVALLAIWEFTQMIGNPVIGGIANSAHLMGGIAGFCYAGALKHPHIVQEIKNRLSGTSRKNPRKNRPKTKNETLSKSEIDALLDKIGKEGMGALSHHERELLKRATRG